MDSHHARQDKERKDKIMKELLAEVDEETEEVEAARLPRSAVDSTTTGFMSALGSPTRRGMEAAQLPRSAVDSTTTGFIHHSIANVHTRAGRLASTGDGLPAKARPSPEKVFTCPNCNKYVLVSPDELNCGVFRHGVFRSTGDQIPSHATQKQCDQWVQSNQIDGCGKPFKYEGNKMVLCDYI